MSDREERMIDIEAIEKRCEAATPEPWALDQCDDGLFMVDTIGDTICFGDPNHKDPDDRANLTFIAHARTDIPALLYALRAATSRADRLEKALREARGIVDDQIEMMRNSHTVLFKGDPDYGKIDPEEREEFEATERLLARIDEALEGK